MPAAMRGVPSSKKVQLCRAETLRAAAGDTAEAKLIFLIAPLVALTCRSTVALPTKYGT